MGWALVAILAPPVLAVAGLAFCLLIRHRATGRLRSTFGGEYDRVVEVAGSRRQGERVLVQRLKLRRTLRLHSLEPAARRRYAAAWRAVQGRFFDEPLPAVRAADELAAGLLGERGYPGSDFEERTALLAIDHPNAASSYRLAHEVAATRWRRRPPNERLRKAMIDYRELFEALVGPPSTEEGPQPGDDASLYADLVGPARPWPAAASREHPPAGGLGSEAANGGSARLHPTVKRVLLGVALVTAYAGVCLAPLAVVGIGYPAPRRPFLIQGSVALGYIGLSMIMLQFVLVSRVRWLAEPFGIDVLHRFHREVSFTALAFILAHPALLLVQAAPSYLSLFYLPTAPWRARFAIASLAALVLVVALSVWRRKLRLSYEVWKLTHAVLAVAVVSFGLAHMVGVDRYTSGLGGRLVVLVTGAAVAAVLAWNLVVSPRVHLFRPWRVVGVIPERGRATTLLLRPEGHGGWSFLPGQFAWVTAHGAPFQTRHQHPFSISSAAEAQPAGQVALTIKGLGDWTDRIGTIEVGSRLYLDGPHGSFSIDLNQAPGYVLIAGGIGVTPLYSMIRTMCEREDSRPVLLFYANPNWESITFREQIAELADRMPNLRVVHVLKKAPLGWTGERGRITADLLGRHLPRRYRSFEFFICAAEAMTEACREALVETGVPPFRIHAERFNTV